MAYYELAYAEVRIGIEGTPGTPPTDGYLVPVKNFSINATRDSAVRILLNAGAVVAKTSLGGRDASGTIEVPMQPILSGQMQYFRSGAPSTTGAGDYVHTFTPTTAVQSSLTIELKLATGEYILCTGCKFGNRTINPQAGATNLTEVYDVIGFDADGTQTTSFLSGTEDDLTGETDYFEHFDATHTSGSTFVTTSWTVSEERPLSPVAILNGSPNAAVIFEGKWQPTGTVTTLGETTNTQAILTKARAGTADSLTLKLVSTATKTFEFTMPTITWVESLPSADGEDIEANIDLGFGADTSYTVVCRNQQATYPI